MMIRVFDSADKDSEDHEALHPACSSLESADEVIRCCFTTPLDVWRDRGLLRDTTGKLPKEYILGLGGNGSSTL